jgi:hypothetical protein
MVSRYEDKEVGINATDRYKEIFRKRKINYIRQFFTQRFKTYQLLITLGKKVIVFLNLHISIMAIQQCGGLLPGLTELQPNHMQI